jgi:hypothetical protein
VLDIFAVAPALTKKLVNATDPVTFNEILELLTSKYTDTHQSAISPTVNVHSRVLTRATSLRPKVGRLCVVVTVRPSS